MHHLAEIRKHVNTNQYIGGLLDEGSGHLHPMKYLQGLAQVASELGVKVFYLGINKKLVVG